MFHVEPSNQAIRMACPKDHLVTKKNFEVWLDPDTQIAQTKPRPDEEYLSSYYVSEEYISHTDTRKTLVEKTYALVQRIMFFKKSKWIRTFLSAEKAYLDFGCGTGAFVCYLQEIGWKAFGVEPNEKARKVYNNPNIVDSLDKIAEDSFDCIALWHVLEHLPQPKSTLQKLIPLLTEKGKLFLAVPNYKSWDAKHYKDHWAAYDVPRHLWHFSYQGLGALAQELNLKVVLKKGLFFDALYVSYLSEKHKNKSLPLIRGIIKGFYSNFKAYFSEEYSSILVVLEKES